MTVWIVEHRRKGARAWLATWETFPTREDAEATLTDSRWDPNLYETRVVSYVRQPLPARIH